jgi:hypothetical protein
MKQPIIEADREYRKKVLIIYVVLVCLGAVVIGWGIPWVCMFSAWAGA